MADKKLIKELYNQGFGYTEISRQIGVTKQRVHQIVKGYRNIGRQGKRKDFYRNMGICELCTIEIAKFLHHKDGNNSNDIIENLERLCGKCHGIRHKELNSKNFKYAIDPKLPKMKKATKDEIYSILKQISINSPKIITKGSTKFDKLLHMRENVPERLRPYIIGKEIIND